MATSNLDPQEPLVYSRDQHSISRKNIDPDALKIMRRLIRHGHKAYLVGGGVRDLMLNKTPKDFDIATDATPRKIKALFRNCRVIGRRFKLAHIYFRGGKIIEVSTFRDTHDELPADEDIDKEELLILRDNVYGSEQTDALRRDITINALFYNLSDFSVIDYVGGVDDLEKGIVRVIGNPDIRFGEDPVRMLRVARHAARAGFSVEAECEASLRRNHELIVSCPAVRLYEEVKKDLGSGCLYEILVMLDRYDLLQHLLPEVTTTTPLLNEGTYFAQCLRHVDQVVRNDGDVSVTAVLALFALFIGQAEVEQPDLEYRFQDKDEIFEFTKDCFVKLAVPRKERERIAHTIGAWQSLHPFHTGELDDRSPIRGSQLKEVIALARYLNIDEQYAALIDHLSELTQRRKPNERRRSTGRGRRGGRGGSSGRRRQGNYNKGNR